MGSVREHPLARPHHELGLLQRGRGGRVRAAPAAHPHALQQPVQRAHPALRQHRRLQALPQHGARREGRSVPAHSSTLLLVLGGKEPWKWPDDLQSADGVALQGAQLMSAVGAAHLLCFSEIINYLFPHGLLLLMFGRLVSKMKGLCPNVLRKESITVQFVNADMLQFTG